MPTHRSAVKRVKQSEKRRQRNIDIKSRLRTSLKRAREAVAAKDQAQIDELVPKTVSCLDEAVSKGVIHRRTADRKKSRLVKQANAVRSSGGAAPVQPEPPEEAIAPEQAEQ